MKKGELLSQFKDQLTIKNYRPQTIKSYVCSMENFLEYTIANPLHIPVKLTPLF
jgi:hypothetical protein